MIKPLYAIVFLAFVSCYSGKAQNNLFVANTTCGKVIDIEPANNGYILLSQTHWAKLDSASKVLSSISYNLGKNNSFEDARFLPDKGFLAVSHISHNVLYAIRLDSSGNEKWVKSYTLPNNYDFQDYGGSSVYISLDRTGGFWLTGNLYDSVKNNYSGLIMETDTIGNVLRSKLVLSDSTSGRVLACNGVGPMVYGPDGSNYFALNVEIFEDGNNCALLKTDSLLNIKWANILENGAVSSNGMLLSGKQIYFAGATYNNNYYSSSISINEYDTAGNWNHELSYNLDYFGNFNCIRETSDSNLVACGSILSNTRANNIPMLVKTDRSLNLQWSLTYPTYPRVSKDDFAYDVKETRKGYIMVGTHIIKTNILGSSGCNDSVLSTGPLPYSGVSKTNMFFLPVTVVSSPATISSSIVSDEDSLLCYSVQGINDPKSNMDELKVFPNPSGGEFTIRFTDITPISSLEVYNELGEKVFTLKHPQSNDQYQIHLNNCPDGLYLYRICSEAGTIIGSGKLSVMH